MFQRLKGPALLFLGGLLCSMAALYGTPVAHVAQSRGDLKIHTELVAAAAVAQSEGQWALREVPRVATTRDPVFIRYPIFQFYSVVPYAVGGLFVHLGLTAYHALLLVILLSFVCGFVGIFGLARDQGHRLDAALAGAIVFTLAPYHLTDWYGRFAVPELAAFGILPLTLWASLRCARSGRLTAFVGASLAWMGLILSHNIFHLYGLLFFALFGLWQAWAGRAWRPWIRPVAAYALAAAASAWFLAPVALNGAQFIVAESIPPFEQALCAPPWVLFSPVWAATEAVRVSNPYLGLQVGGLLLAGALVAWRGWERSRSAHVAALLGLFALSLFIAWSPFDFWRYLGPLRIVQFPYRLLIFSTLFGALLVAEAWSGALAQRGRAARAGALALLCLATLAVGAPYVQAKATQWPATMPGQFYQQFGFNMRAVYDYVYRPALVPPRHPGDFDRSQLRVDMEKVPAKPMSVHVDSGLLTEVTLDDVREAGTVLLPSAWYPELYQLRVNGQAVPYLRSTVRYRNRLAVQVPAGRVKIDYRFVGLPWANALSRAAWVLLVAVACAGAYQVLAAQKSAD